MIPDNRYGHTTISKRSMDHEFCNGGMAEDDTAANGKVDGRHWTLEMAEL